MHVSRIQAIQFGFFRLHREDYHQEALFQSMPTTYFDNIPFISTLYKTLCSVEHSSVLYNITRLPFHPHHCCRLISASLQHQAVLCIIPAFIINCSSVRFHETTL